MGGYERHKERRDALNLLGKDLARRAASKCELCEEGGQRLDPYEPPPVEDDPSFERTMLVCEKCRRAAEGGPMKPASEWRFLETVGWSTIPAVQVTAIRMLRRLAADDVAWARDAAESIYPSEEAAAWLDE